MKNIKRPLAAVGVGAMLAFSLTACGGGAPTDASVEEFCGLEEEFDDSFDEIGEEDYEALADAAAEMGERAEEVGTPEDISDEAREGFEILIEQVQDLDPDELESGINSLMEDIAAGEGPEDENAMAAEIFGVSGDDAEKVVAYFEYSDETC